MPGKRCAAALHQPAGFVARPGCGASERRAGEILTAPGEKPTQGAGSGCYARIPSLQSHGLSLLPRYPISVRSTRRRSGYGRHRGFLRWRRWGCWAGIIYRRFSANPDLISASKGYHPQNWGAERARHALHPNFWLFLADCVTYAFKRSRYCLRNLATFGAITAWQ